MPGPDFIGLGAQKAGTSWIYACLYEHPSICIPQKELHYFSRQRNWSRGREWYEGVFDSCGSAAVKGEFSTSYLFDPLSAERIHALYPGARLLASLRNPVDRAFSNYVNDIKAGVVAPSSTFDAAIERHPEYLDQGQYCVQLDRYLRRFDRRQMLILIYEDIDRGAGTFLRSIYRFLGVDEAFVPSHLGARVNVGRVPRFVALEKALNTVAGALRRAGFGRLVWYVKQSGVPERIRALNQRRTGRRPQTLTQKQRRRCYQMVRQDILRLEEVLGRRLPWHVD
jgi:hypothetical protein